MTFTDIRGQGLRERLALLEGRLSVLVDGSPLGIFFDDADDRCVFVNATFCQMMELSEEEALGDGWVGSVHPEDLPRLMTARARSIADGAAVFSAEYRFVCRSGRSGWVEEQTRPVLDPDGRLVGYVGTVADITRRKADELERSRYRATLEEQVRSRTHELQVQTEHLAEANAALKALLRQRDEDREELERAVMSNMHTRILPALDRLERLCSEPASAVVLGEIRQSLHDVTSPFRQRLGAVCQGLTPAEMQVAEFIRQGLSTKEIAVRLGVGTSTIDTHRHHMRRKLGLDIRSRSLRTYLMTLEQA